MGVHRSEPFATGHAMILVALIAVGLAGGIAYSDHDKFSSLLGLSNLFPGELAVCCLTVFLLIGATGLLLVRLLRRPRPRQSALGAGTAGNLAALVCTLFIAILWTNVFLHQLYASGSRSPLDPALHLPGPALALDPHPGIALRVLLRSGSIRRYQTGRMARLAAFAGKWCQTDTESLH